MKEENLDRRVRKTRKLLRQCLTALLKKKKIQDITVREISDMADINRGTFYLHYKDVFDLMEQIETELLDELEHVLKRCQPGDLLTKPTGIFTEVYSLVKENSDIVAILIGENGDLNFVNRLNHIVREKCLKDWMDLFCAKDSLSFDAYYSFIVAGCIGIVQYWLKTNMQESPEQLAAMTEQIIIKGIRVFEPTPPSV
ncbi:MAG: TetR-like C-terminal domain-containing protein [Hungatella sp.]